ncbi:MAG: type II toxin-antitoxin system RelE/ParE family toxin [Treponema sp.]|nr:type II toxin-antitoxin system RelE/ParE family toxin [Treponema sp.]
MDQYEIIIEPSAEDDLKNIYDYIANTLLSENNARKQVERIRDTIFELETMPESYHLYPNETWHSKGLHYVPVGNYEIFYTVNNNDFKVNILRVLYGKMNFLEIWK